MSLEVIGQKLKSAREAQGLSLRHIYERTKIPINHLQAIDLGQPDDLPEPVYVAGFIKRYAECIGLDGQVLADEYRRVDHGNGNGKPAVAQPVYVTSDYLKHTRIDNRAPSYKLVPFYAMAIIALIAVLSWYFSSQSNNAAQSDPSTLSLRDSIAHMPPQQAAAVAPGTAAGAAQAPGAAAAGGDPNKLTLTANKHVWVQVSKLNSDETVYIGFLEQGSPRTFDEAQGLRIRAGNGASLSVEYKGKTEPFGPDGKPLERTFAADTTQQASATTGGATTTAANGTTTTGTAAGTTAASSATKTKKIAKKTDGTNLARRWRTDDGTRSIPGEGDGMRSIDVPYRYSEGRLDAN